MYAEVLIEYKVKSLDRSFTYKVPEELKEKIKIGMKVSVPFGQGNSFLNGFVIGIKTDTDCGNLKSIICINDEELVLNSELMELGKYLRDTTLCTLISAYQTMLPASLKIKTQDTNYQKSIAYLKLKVPREFLKGYLLEVKGIQQKRILEDLLDNGKVKKTGYSPSSVKSLVDKGIIEIDRESIYRIDAAELEKEKTVELTEDQENALNKVLEKKDSSETFLLHGVTGSGKTEVYMNLIEEILKTGKSAIMLVPEITLTTQIVNNFYSRFGNKVSILHSGLSNGEKYDEYLKILRHDTSIVVGTRSAVFAPLENLGIIIIDEEHSESYKQDNTPRYNAIDIAKWRSKYNKIPLVLGSATPTYESFARALKGVYTLISMPKRIGEAQLPKITIVDMASEARCRNMILSARLKELIEERLAKSEQVILLLNRRGFGTLVTCNLCGHTFKCPNCDITLTYHKSSNSLRCHYCGYYMKKPEICPECKEGLVKDSGLGTEKLEEEIKKTFSGARVVRMDADTTSRKGSHEKIIKDFREEKYDILLGTQMISKGLDFPRVSLVGVVSADASLNIPDFRSGERTYALLSQVSGRAGRSGLDSEVVVQTFNPDNFTLKMVEMGSFLKNYQYEMSIRKKLKYPPYYYLVLVRVCSRIYEDASLEVTKVAHHLKSNLDKETIVLGPTTAGVFRVNNVYRFQLVIKYRKDANLLRVLREIDAMYINHKTVYLEVDIDPYYL